MAQQMKWMLLITALLAFGCLPSRPPEDVTISLGGEQWIMELAIDPDEIQTGLMHRTTMEPGHGMIFIFPVSGIHSFWMAYCLTDIDLIFVDGTGRITATHMMHTEPPKSADESEQAYLRRMPGYASVFPARIALELPPGSIEKLGLLPGQATGLEMQKLEDLRKDVAISRRRAGSREQP